MKISVLKQLTIIVTIVAIAGLYSCKKDKDNNASPTTAAATPKGAFMFHLHTYIDQQEVDLYNTPYTTDDGRNISLSIAQMYISSIQLEKADGTWLDVPGKIVLKTFEAESYEVGDVPVGNYKTVRFKVGLDSTVNAANPTAIAADSLVLNKPAMWYGATAQPEGYIFMNVQGKVDTTADMTGALIPFVYKIGTNANYKQVVMPDKNYAVTEGQATFCHLIIDYSKIFSGINLSQSASLSVAVAADNSGAVAAAIVNNIPLMFRYEE